MDAFLTRTETPDHALRRASLDDMASVAALHRLAFFPAMPHMPMLHTPEEDLEFFSTVVFPNTQIWLCERQGIVAGFIAFRPGWVDHLYVHPDHQRRGIGSGLLALAQSAEQSLHLWAFQCNLPARRFYEGHGFQIERETDGATNAERQPDILYFWSRTSFPK
jgi:ribosomal protein S18 acetylase RimI-like enzyme